MDDAQLERRLNAIVGLLACLVGGVFGLVAALDPSALVVAVPVSAVVAIAVGPYVLRPPNASDPADDARLE